MNGRDDYLAHIEAAVGGAYRMGDGRDFWMDGPAAREVARRAAEGVGAYVRKHEPGGIAALEAELAAARLELASLNAYVEGAKANGEACRKLREQLLEKEQTLAAAREARAVAERALAELQAAMRDGFAHGLNVPGLSSNFTARLRALAGTVAKEPTT